jgi:hypothetical protein
MTAARGEVNNNASRLPNNGETTHTTMRPVVRIVPTGQPGQRVANTRGRLRGNTIKISHHKTAKGEGCSKSSPGGSLTEMMLLAE